MTAGNLSMYKARLDNSFVMKDLKKYKNLPRTLENKHLFTTYPRLLSNAAQTYFRVDGVDKKSKENAIVKSFFTTRRVKGLLGDVLGMARAWR